MEYGTYLYGEGKQTLSKATMELKEEGCRAIGEEGRVSEEGFEDNDCVDIARECAQRGGSDSSEHRRAGRVLSLAVAQERMLASGENVVVSEGEDEEGRWVGPVQVIGKGCRGTWIDGRRHRLHVAESAIRAKRRREAIEEEEGDKESETSVLVKDGSHGEVRRWEALGSDNENELEWEELEYEEGSSEKGAQTDGRKYVYNKKEVTDRVHRMDKVVRVGFDVDDADVILRSKCTLGNLVKLNVTLDDFHKDTVRVTVFRTALEYSGIEVWFYEHTTLIDTENCKRYPRIANHDGQYVVVALLVGLTEEQIVPVLHSRSTEVGKDVVKDYMTTPKFFHYLEDGKGVLSAEERINRTRQEAARWRWKANKLELRL
ncbi:hypothetical protein Cgig2_010869 [Carnegiea gigantea]|uniref:Uncharacterized protein n=1 Tax=Carnegiea gigantea TaxID=171969 RepID=A0A9Q1GSE1_9CARY|nr:hypothetical protein Cgig2_010869 [Carnegiea gigantea]